MAALRVSEPQCGPLAWLSAGLFCLRGWIGDFDDAGADDLFARAGRHIDPGFRIAVRRHVAMARVRARRAVVLAGLDDAGALLGVVVGERSRRGAHGADRKQTA